MAPKAKKVEVAADPASLAREVAELLRDEAKREAFLDLRCGAVGACKCLLAAASTSLDGAGGCELEAKASLEEAPPRAAAALLQLASGDEVQLRDDTELMELFTLTKKLGADACSQACVQAIGDVHNGKLPVKVGVAAADTKRYRARLHDFYAEGRFTDVVLRMPVASAADDGGDGGGTHAKELRVHRVVLAASSAYFAGLWAGGFAETASPAVDVDAEPSLAKALVNLVYGIKVEVGAPDELVKLLVLADKWQMPAVATALLVQLEATLSPSDAVGILGSTNPDSVSKAALAALAAEPDAVDKLFEASPRVAAELLSTMGDMPQEVKERLQLAFQRHAELGGDEAATALTPDAMAGIIDRTELVPEGLIGKSILHWALRRATGNDLVEPISGLHGALLEEGARLSETAEQELCKALVEYFDADEQKALPLVESIIAGHPGGPRVRPEAEPALGYKDVIEVVGCGSSKYNGLYVPGGISDGKTRYRRLFGGQILKYCTCRWYLKPSDSELSEYKSPADKGPLPPASSWEATSDRVHGSPPSAVRHHAHAYPPTADSCGEEDSGGSPVSGRKRGRDLGADTALEAAASWVRSDPKRLKTSTAWTAARPSAFAAVMTSQPCPELWGDVESLLASWLQGAQLGSVLEALTLIVGTSGGTDARVLNAILTQAQSKAISLEEQNAALGGSGLRDARDACWDARAAADAAQEQAAAAQAEALTARAREEMASTEAATARSEAEAARAQLEAEQQRHKAIQAEIEAAVRGVLAKHRPGAPAADPAEESAPA